MFGKHIWPSPGTSWRAACYTCGWHGQKFDTYEDASRELAEHRPAHNQSAGEK